MFDNRKPNNKVHPTVNIHIKNSFEYKHSFNDGYSSFLLSLFSVFDIFSSELLSSIFELFVESFGNILYLLILSFSLINSSILYSSSYEKN